MSATSELPETTSLLYRQAVGIEQRGGVVMSPSQNATATIRVEHVSKVFAMPQHRSWTLKERMRHPILSSANDHLQALDDVSFEVNPGEFFAVIGRNGSGKSTLLRCIAGIHQPDAGRVEVNARIAPFIELGVGFHPQLAAADNVLVAGTLLGLRPAEARRRFPSVISFAELEEFVEMPIANYSSGMQVRLAFSTSFQVDAELLLFDEVLAVGDELFRRKCMDTFDRLIERGHTIIYVTHQLETVSRFADRVLLLDRGEAVALGPPEEVLEEYHRRNSEYKRKRERLEASEPAPVESQVTAQPLGEYGNAEHIASPRRFADVVVTLARAEFKLRYLDSVIGYMWSLAQPLLLYLVLYFVWTKLFPPAAKVPHYKLGLLLGIALFTFFSEATGQAMSSLVGKGTMLRKIPFTPLALPLSSTLTSFFVYGLTLIIVFGFILVSGVTPTFGWLEMVPILVLLLTFTIGTGLILSLVFVSLRDVQQIWVVVLRLLFFLTPVFYSIQLAPAGLRHFIMLNPLAVVIVQARHVLLDPTAPTALQAGGVLPIAFALTLSVATVLVGLWGYRRFGPRVAERI
jgi:ABC-type polysaccharide/polyol phosphate transport system ATPase subunit/ABC-type polysaccharide/polyol phosphate export permease